MMQVYIQMAMVMVFGTVLFAAVRLRANGTVSVSQAMEQFREIMVPVPLTREQRKAVKKNTRKIGWAGRRLIQGRLICKFKTKRHAFNHLVKMAKSEDRKNIDRVVAILEQLAKGEGDARFKDKAMELLKSTDPRKALKLQVAINKKSAQVIEMPEQRAPLTAMAEAA